MAASLVKTRAAFVIAKILAIAFVLFLGALDARPSAAATEAQERAALEARQAQLFQAMLRNPGDLDATFAYADVSARLGDYEAAVSALERMLLFNPNLPRVDLELGALYFRMGSFAVAESYFDKALAQNPPPDVRARIAEYLAQIRGALSRHHVTGYFLFGTQYQSDANVAPGSATIQSPIGTLLLAPQFVKAPDNNFFMSGSVIYDYDLETQNRDAIEVTGVGFMNHYFIFDRLDLDYGEVTAGPRLNFPHLPGVSGASFKPYVILNEVGLGENQYFWTYGAGLEYDEIVWHDLALRAVAEARQKHFANAPDRPLSTGLNGHDTVVSLTAVKPITANSALSAQFDFLNQDTVLPFYSNNTYGVSGAYHIRYPTPRAILPNFWESTFFLSRSWSYYAAPDPCCNTSGSPFFFSPSNRFDRHWRFGLTQSLIITPRLALVLQVQRDILSSNLSLYGYTSDSVLLGPQIRF
ncbi:MAG TPA: tetratricopeptide repeat protein [Stellaceae bacterium]|nr:tetratricopeptide repeat protein [Stellaceae bacterium]